jgi:predicted dithiol-disulfide oxidoreductase (DUF899 family)
MEAEMSYQDSAAALAAYRGQIAELRRKMREVQAAAEPEVAADYAFATPDGTTKLSDLFGVKDDLIVIHNMGISCPSCTLWADGFNGIYEHLANRAAFVVCSPDTLETQRSFAASRGWRFPMVSHQGTTFAADMGYQSERGGWLPGVSVFRRDGDRIVRVADTRFQPGDDFCTLWHLLDLLPGGAAGWSARFSYG